MKTVGQIIESYGAPALIGNSCEDFQSRNTRGSLLRRNKEITQENLTGNSIRLKFVKRTSITNPVKSSYL